jgi:glycosyltransferase involved in cell wall biosynthesis
MTVAAGLAAPSVAVLVPCRDEGLTVGAVVRDFQRALPGCTVHVCDNGSSDATAVLAARAGATVSREPHPGKGRALQRLLREADADVYVVVDGDGTYDAAAAPQLVRELCERRLDMVVAVREPVSAAACDRYGHRLGNALLSRLVRLLHGGRLTDVLSGYRVLSRDLVDGLRLTSTGFEVEAEITAHALHVGARCAELATPYRARHPGAPSKLRTCRDGSRVLLRVVTSWPGCDGSPWRNADGPHPRGAQAVVRR